MKKIILPFCLIALISIALLSMNKFSPKINFSGATDTEKSENPEHQIKYSDCIDMGSMYVLDSENPYMQMIQQNELYGEINQCLRKYQQSLDSTIKNLNSIDAHEFLHNEFERCKNQIDSDSLSAIKVFYHKGIMEICYDRDKKLNSISTENIAKR
ncbi:hypothetical protein [Flagellimonas sp.]|uniref:hypothetical protein n=1 Tax=Flagellimonas sp. TaxID=2058762 RepID=UPI003B513A61